MRPVGKRAIEMLAFTGLLAIAHALTAVADASAASDAASAGPIWLPLGVAIAGLHRLGWRAAWAVGATALVAAWLSAPFAVAVAIATASSTAAAGGAALLTQLAVGARLDRLRDVWRLALVAVAAASLFWLTFGLAAIAVGDAALAGPAAGFVAQALGALVVLPVALTWRAGGPAAGWPGADHRNDTRHRAAALAAATVAWLAIATATADSAPVLALLLVAGGSLLAVVAAMRFGPRGSAGIAALAALWFATWFAAGPAVRSTLPGDDATRFGQLVVLSLAGVPLLVAALLAERDARTAAWLRAEGLRRATLGMLPDLACRLRPDGRFEAIAESTPARHVTAKVLGRRIQDLAEPAVVARVLEQMHVADRGEAAVPVDLTIDSASGPVDLEVRFARVPDREVLALIRDVTEQRRSAQQLAWQAKILELIAGAHRRQEVFAELVAGLERLLPDSRCSILLRNGQRLHVGWAPSLPADYNTAIEGLEIAPDRGSCGAAAWANTTVVCGDLSTDPRWTELRGLVRQFGIAACWSLPVRSTDNTVLGTLAVYHGKPHAPARREIAFVERAAALVGLAIERERRENLLVSIQRNVSEGLYRSLPGEDFVHVNDSFAILFGYGSADQLLREWRDTDVAMHRSSLDLLAHETLSTRQRELQLQRRDGSAFWALVSTTVAFHDDDAELVCDGSVADITARKELEEQLRQAQKMEAVGQLAGGVAHDFNNVLTAITGFAEAVRSQLPTGSRQRRDIDQLLAAAARAASLTRQLLAFGRRQVLTPRVVEIGGVVEQLGDMLQHLIGKHIELVHERANSSVRATVDRGQLEQILLNLVINARDAMPAGGRVSVGTAEATIEETERPVDLAPGRYAVLTVSDTGTGMTPDTLARAFDPFFTTKGPGKGTGLGLSTVYGIARQSGGTVAIDSELRRGTRVSVYLPFASELPSDDRPVPIPRPAAGAGIVLVVEDDDLVRELAERALSEAGYEVVTAANGIAALAAFHEHRARIDLVVTDMIMPQMGGQELARQLRQSAPELRMIFMSGYSEDGIDDAGVDSHRVAFVQKPFTAWELAEAADRLLATRPQRRDAGRPLPGSR